MIGVLRSVFCKSNVRKEYLGTWLSSIEKKRDLVSNLFTPGDDGLFFGDVLAFGSCAVMAVKFAIHEALSCSISQLPQGFDLGWSASVTTMQISSVFSWRLSPP